MDTLKLVGRTSSEIVSLRFPTTLLNFCGFDLSYFAKGAIDICNEALKSGSPNYERMMELKNDIRILHCYIEQHIRTTYDKIIEDCWIDYICRRDNIGLNTLWNRFIRCKSPFEKTIFARLCELRYHKAINEWVNIVRIQDYAKTKLGFIFTSEVKSVEDAAARRDYFDLMFSVTARELGCRLEDLGVTKVFTVGRTPSAPFMFPNISKEIVRHVLQGFDYTDDYSGVGDYSEISDELAMDAFTRMKPGLPPEPASYNVSRGKMEMFSGKIYMPCSLKAAIDLEFDAIIESGGWLAKCKRCGRYFLRDKNHIEEYCSRIVEKGKTCLEIYEEEHPRVRMTPELEQKCREVTDEMYRRVDVSISVKEYEYWHSYTEAMKNKVNSGEIPPEEFENFLNYSLAVDISKSHPIQQVERPAPDAPKERVVKPFIPERISRSELAPKQSEPEPKPVEKHPEGFFTSPIVQRQKDSRPISHIIRNGESLGETHDSKPDPSGFQPFIQPASQPQNPAPKPRKSPYEDLKRLEEKLEEEKRLRAQQHEQPRPTNGFTPFIESPVQESEPLASIPEPTEISEFQSEPPTAPKPKVIRKNAAAISAYGKIAGATVTTAPPEMEITSDSDLSDFNKSEYKPNEKNMENVEIPSLGTELPDSEPFKNIGSIFDILEQSERDMSGANRRKPRDETPEPVPEWEDASEPPKRVTRENLPEGFWTEERHLFPEQEIDEQVPTKQEPEPSELDMLKEKKHVKSNKTKRLYDIIMRDAEDNPNFRKKP